MDAQKYTLGPIGRRLRNLAKHVNLDNPDEVKSFIARIDTHARAETVELLENRFDEDLVLEP